MPIPSADTFYQLQFLGLVAGAILAILGIYWYQFRKKNLLEEAEAGVANVVQEVQEPVVGQQPAQQPVAQPEL